MKKRTCIILLQAALLMAWYVGPCAAAMYHDALGRPVKIQGRPKRIVSLAPSLTEILFFIGVGSRVVGVTRYSTYPPEARSLPRVGSYVNLNVERIISLAPDLVIGTKDGNEPGAVRLLEQAGLAVYIVNPRTVMETAETIERIGEICGVGARGRELGRKLRGRVTRIVRKTASLPRPLVFVQINIKPIMTVNETTFHHDVIRLAGGRNLAAGLPVTYPRMGVEAVIQRKPDVIIISSMDTRGAYERARREWLQWTQIPAAREGRVYLVNSDLIDRPSPRIVQGLETVARILHPEIDWGS
ncbi:MAG: cobalamin-binding protein [Deltaproteobacteria bacterium]|nr:cobalamin-binding protein [Deltaproteobacteria bacterium]